MRTATSLLIVMLIGFVPGFITGENLQEETLFEKVEVVNIKVPVRVFSKGKPVKGLKKEDFKLFVNGEEKEIRALVEKTKNITLESPASGAGAAKAEANPNPRLFLLMFNISDDRIDMKKTLDPFFNDILRPGDRLMLVSNSFVLNDRIVFDPKIERQKIDYILDVESVKARARLIQMSLTIDTLYKDYLDMLQAIRGEIADAARRYFIDNYIAYIKDFKKGFMRLDDEQYVQLANYLANQDIEKWVLNFYQLGYFARVRPLSSLDESLSSNTNYLEMLQALDVPEEIAEKNISRFFLNTGASFHTILMGSRNRILNYDVFSYNSIPINSESLLKRLTKLTGGIVIRSNKAGKFFKKLTQQEDVYYTLFYAPDLPREGKKAKIEVKVNNKDYKVVYDTRKRETHFQRILDKVKKGTPQITLGEIKIKEDSINFLVKNFKMDQVDQEKQGKVRVRISIFDDRESKFIVDRKKEAKAKKENLDFNIALKDELKPGNYKIFVEVTDLFTKKNDLGVGEIRIM